MKLATRKYFFDLLKTTLEKHDIQSGQSFWDGRSVFQIHQLQYHLVIIKIIVYQIHQALYHYIMFERKIHGMCKVSTS